MLVVILALMRLAACDSRAQVRGPTAEELERERFGWPDPVIKTIQNKEKTAKGNYYFLSTDGKYCKLGVYGPMAPVSDFDRMSSGDRYECFWNWEKNDR